MRDIKEEELNGLMPAGSSTNPLWAQGFPHVVHLLTMFTSQIPVELLSSLRDSRLQANA